MKIFCKILFFLVLFAACNTSKAQMGFLEVYFNLYGNTYDNEHLTIQILKDDSVIVEHKEFIRDVEIYTDSLKAGSYKVRYFINFKKDILGEIKNVKIIEEELTKVIFYPPRKYTTNNLTDTLSYFDTGGYALINFSTGNNFINPDNEIFSGYNQFGFQIGGTSSLFRFAKIGQQFGSNMNYTYFNESKSLAPNFDKDTEKYYYWNLSYMIFLRATFYNNYKKNKGLFLDGGISYNFPLLFRYVLVKGDTKTVTKKIHHYNDFSAIFRLGYQPIAFTFEYRLTNFLDKNFPEQPKMKVGVSFIFGE